MNLSGMSSALITWTGRATAPSSAETARPSSSSHLSSSVAAEHAATSAPTHHHRTLSEYCHDSTETVPHVVSRRLLYSGGRVRRNLPVTVHQGPEGTREGDVP